MHRNPGACLICGEPLQYFQEAKSLTCAICHKPFESHASCKAGHFVCDACHAQKGLEAIITFCQKCTGSDPIRLAMGMMEDPFIYMHGPEHHVLVGAALLCAYYHARGEEIPEAALSEMLRRGKDYPGGSCGFWGCCGAAVSTGMFVSIVTGATPLTTRTWALSNEMTADALHAIAALGGPRCCKRNSFTAIREAVRFANEKLDVRMMLPEQIRCSFSSENRECKRNACPYYPSL